MTVPRRSKMVNKPKAQSYLLKKQQIITKSQMNNNLSLKSIKKSDTINNITKEAKEIVANLKLEKKIINHLPNKKCQITLVKPHSRL